MLRYTDIACLISKYFSHYDRSTVGLFLEQYANLRLDSTPRSVDRWHQRSKTGVRFAVFLLFMSVQFDSGAHSYTVYICTIRSFAGDKAAGRVSLPRRAISAEVRNASTYTLWFSELSRHGVSAKGHWSYFTDLMRSFVCSSFFFVVHLPTSETQASRYLRSQTINYFPGP
jgi:hypothetical protein